MNASDDFYRGVLWALATINLRDEPTYYDEIVDAVGRWELLRVARNDRDMRWSGMADYERRRRQDGPFLAVAEARR